MKTMQATGTLDDAAYQQLFDQILEDEQPGYPYSNPAYLNYTKLNRSRMRRWDKQLQLPAALVEKITALKAPQHWVIITEPWCGDAAHILPYLMRMASLSDKITYEIVLRDTEPFLIDSYLTNGGKSIPKLVVRDVDGNDLFTWGPRPAGAQQLLNNLKQEGADGETTKLALQHWYNEDAGRELCAELIELL